MICKSGGSKSRPLKAASAERPGQMRNAKLRAAVVRSAFSSQNAQNAPGSDHFWKLGCGKMARRCGSECLGPLLEVRTADVEKVSDK